MPSYPTRRAALAGLGVALVAAPLAACGIRLEEGAPRVPLIPTREPVPGEAFLLDLWTGSTALAEQAAAVRGGATSVPARLAPIHREQAAVLRSVLSRLGVPASVLEDAQRSTRASAAATATSQGSATGADPGVQTSTPTAGPTGAGGTDTPGPGTTAVVTAASLAAREVAALAPDAFTSLAELDDETVTVASALLAQRGAAAILLGETPSWPRDEWSDAALAARLLETTRSAVYGFEVVAAQSRRAQATLAKETLAALKSRAAEQQAVAGPQATPPAVGYPLPFQVTKPADAKRLAVHVLTGLRDAVAADVLTASGRAEPLAALTRWLAETEVLASRWGVALEPFPGLQ